MAANDSPAFAASQESHYLNIVRLVSALIVVIGHIRTNFFLDYAMIPASPLAAVLYVPTTLGGGAVIVFFALSGYLVGGPILASGGADFAVRDYALKRLVRLWLVLLPALVLTMALDAIGMALLSHADLYTTPVLYASFPDPIDHGAAVLLANAAFLQDLATPVYGYNTPLWSLSYEFWYYVLFPSVIYVVKGKAGAAAKAAALGLAALSIWVGGWPFLALFPAWLFGALAGARPKLLHGLKPRIGARGWACLQLLAAVLIVLALVAARAGRDAFPYLGPAMIGLITSAAFLVLNSDGGAPSYVTRKLSDFSRCTYSLYSIHMPIVVLAAALLVPDFDRRWNLVSLQGLFVPAFTAVLLLIAMGFAAFTEARTNRVRKRVAALLGW